MYSIKKERLKALTLITSASCNLQCEYCEIRQSQNDHSSVLAKQTAEALKNGTFLENCKKSLLKLKVPFSQIEEIYLWGMEPTLTLPYITENLDKWFETFPNLNTWFFSSNMTNYPDRIINFLKACDAQNRENFVVKVQMSYDEQWSTSNLRKTEPNNILKNIQTIIEECNQTNFKNINIRFSFHGVVSRDLINLLDTFEKIKAYLFSLDRTVSSLVRMSTNKKVFIVPEFTTCFENPIDATSEDGRKHSYFIQQALYVKDEEFLCKINPIKGYVSQLFVFEQIPFIKNDNDVLKLLSNIINNNLTDQEFRDCQSRTLCGNNTLEIKLLWDGTLVNCQNHIHDLKLENLTILKNDLKNEIRKSLINHHYYVNLLKSSDKQIENLFYLSDHARFQGFFFMYQQVFKAMQFLAEAGQINPEYLYDKEKLLRHAFYITAACPCAYISWTMTGSMLLRDLGAMRFFANGALDIIDELYKERVIRKDVQSDK